MMRKVKVVKYGQQPAMSKPGYSRGFNSGQFPVYYPGTEWTKPGTEVSKGLKPVSWDEANVEAEGGETAYVPDQGGLPAHFNINGPRHSQGGVPLNLPPDTFIYSDTSKMKLKGPITEYFGKTNGKAYTPADLAKQYDINKYRKILQNPDSDDIQRHSAELMIQNYNKKLGALALAQEGKKGFPDGVPVAAIPFLMSYAIEPENVLPSMPQQQGMPMMQSPMPGAKKGGATGTWAAPNYYQIGGTYSAQTEPEFGGNWMGKARAKKQIGGSNKLTPEQENAANQAFARLENYGWRGQGNPEAESAYQQQLINFFANSQYDIANKIDSLNKVYPKVSVNDPNSSTSSEVNWKKVYNPNDPKIANRIYQKRSISGIDSKALQQLAATEKDTTNEYSGTQRLKLPENQPNPYFINPFYIKQQYGGEGNDEQSQILQVIQMYAQASGQDPDEIVSQLKQMQPEQAQQALQQMAQSLQGSQDDMSDMPAMAYGGYIPMAQIGVTMPPKRFSSYSGKNDPSTGYWDRVSKANVFMRPEGSDAVAIDPQYTEAIEKLIPFYGAPAEGLMDWAAEAFMLPQKEINHLLTGYYETPGTTMQRYRPGFTDENKFWLDIATDPLITGDLVANGLYKGIQKAAPPVAAAAAYVGDQAVKHAKFVGKKLAPLIGKVDPAKVVKYSSKVGQAAAHRGYGERPEAAMVAKPTPAVASSTAVAPRVAPPSPIVNELNEAQADSALKAMGLIKQYGGSPDMLQFGYRGQQDVLPRQAPQPTGNEIDLPLSRVPNMQQAQAMRDSALNAQQAARVASQPRPVARPQAPQVVPAVPATAPVVYPRNSAIQTGGAYWLTDANGQLSVKIPKASYDKYIAAQKAEQEAAAQATQAATTTTAGTTQTTPKKTAAAANATFDPNVKISDDPMWTTGIELLKKDFGSNEKLKDALYEKWKSRPENKNKSLDRDQVVENFLKAQEQVYAIQKSLSDDDRKSGKWDKGTKKNEVYLKTAQKLGFTPLTEDEIATFQSAYIALNDLYKDTKDPEIKSTLDKFNIRPVGVADEQFGDQKNISKVDSWFGNTTLGQAVTPKLEAAPPAPKKKGEERLKTETANYVAQPAGAPWWAQDLVNMYGAAGDFLRLKKYLPWAPETEPVVPEPVFYDPTRALAANAEQANIASQAASTFGAPQQFSARSSGIQGQAAKNAANILGEYEAKNVGVANTFAGQVAGIYNRNNEMDARRAQDLYDKTVTANQQFDNSRNQARQNLRQSYIAGLTNRAQAQAMNTMYPDYYVDPSTGGFVGFKPGVNPMETSSGNDASDFDTWMDAHKKIEPDKAAKVWLELQKNSKTGRTPSVRERRSASEYGYPSGYGYMPYPGVNPGYGYFG